MSNFPSNYRDLSAFASDGLEFSTTSNTAVKMYDALVNMVSRPSAAHHMILRSCSSTSAHFHLENTCWGEEFLISKGTHYHLLLNGNERSGVWTDKFYCRPSTITTAPSLEVSEGRPRRCSPPTQTLPWARSWPGPWGSLGSGRRRSTEKLSHSFQNKRIPKLFFYLIFTPQKILIW